MAKSLSERIAHRVSTRQPSRTGRNRASFLAIREDVKEALHDGWSVKVIWDTLRDEGKIEFGYDAFISYVNRLIRNVEMRTQAGPPTNRVEASKAKVELDAQQEQKKKAPSIEGFNFNPTPNKEDLF